MKNIISNISSINERIKKAALRSNRSADEIALVAVSKKTTAEKIAAAASHGQMLFGENYLQEAKDKFAPLLNSLPRLKLHLIGHLQTNKTKEAAKLFHVIETVDRLKLAISLEKYLRAENRKRDIYIQINIGGEPQKSGVLPENAAELITEIKECDHLNIRGLMTIPPFNQNPQSSRPYFRAMKELSRKLINQGLLDESQSGGLSMGMSDDFEIAIEEGATLVRVGTAIFGERT